MTYLEEYGTAVLDGKIVACRRIKQVYEKLLNDLYNPQRYHFDEAIANRHINFIETFCKQSAGDIGAPLELQLFQKAKFQAIFGFVDDNNLRRYRECLTIEGRKNGKALALDTEIPTPFGWTRMQDLRVGDYVFDVLGRPCPITLTSDVFINHNCYRVTFEDGAEIICDAEHLWTVRDKKNKIVTKKTSELLHFKRERADGKGTEYLYRVPMNDSVKYEYKELPADPYTIGAWLGDGDKNSTRITCSDADREEMMRNVAKQGHVVSWHDYRGINRTGCFTVDSVGLNKPNRFVNALRDIGVFQNKHIPSLLLCSSVEQRWELLRGLMDTDGYCSKNGECEFCQKDYDFTVQFRELISSLGIKSSVHAKTINCNGKNCTAYSVLFFTDKQHSCFKLSRKHARLKEQLGKRMNYKSIIDIQAVETVPCKCIAIDSASHLYCAGRQYTVTHNTTEMAAIELDLLINDHEGAPEIYNIATKLDQAKKGFDEAHHMLQQSPELSKHLKKRQSDIYFPANMGKIKALASNSNSLDGLNSHGVVIDELAAIKNRDIYDLMKQSMGARSQPLLFCITTNGFVRDNIFDNQYDYACNVLDGVISDETFLPFIYELDEQDEWLDRSKWIKANPGLGTIKSEKYLAECVEKAKVDASFRPTVLVKDFNLKQNAASAWLTWEELDCANPNVPQSEFDYCIGGFDAADTTDLNAAVALTARPNDDNIYVKSMFWIPQEVLDRQAKLGTRRERDNAPYSEWVDAGYMRAVQGNRVEKQVFLDWYEELREQGLYTLFLGFDPWHIDDSMRARLRGSFGERSLIPVRQGAFTLSEPMKELKAQLGAHKVIYDNPVLKMCLANSEAKVDINGNQQPVKGQDARKRIDGTVALLCAYRAYMDNKDEFINLNNPRG